MLDLLSSDQVHQRPGGQGRDLVQVQIDGCEGGPLLSRPQAVIARDDANIAGNGATLVTKRSHRPGGERIDRCEDGVCLGDFPQELSPYLTVSGSDSEAKTDILSG